MKIMMTGGGTGGHIYPAIAIADKIKEKHPEAEILFVGTQRGLEKTLVPQSGYSIRFITVSGFNRKNLFKNIKVLKDLSKGMEQARALIREFRPDVVIGTGGYVCGPIVKMAGRMGIKAFIHEQNAFPGLTNKLLEKHVDRVFLGFKEAESKFKNPKKLIYTGNPVRKAFYEANAAMARKALGIDANEFVVLSFGGSQGASKINQAMVQASKTLLGINHVRIYFVTGRLHHDKIVKELKERGVGSNGNVKVLPYVDKMDQYLAACDLVISRAGALTVSEIAVCGKPAVLIPSPNVTGNHQYYNAKALAQRGGAILMEEKDLSGEALIDILMKFASGRDALDQMAKKSKAVAEGDAAEIIYQYLQLD